MTTPDITIPSEALEAAAEAEYYACFGQSAGPWKDAPDWIKQSCRNHALAACLAMLRSWPGMATTSPGDGYRFLVQHIILPLPENTNDKA